jgi:hypothetical protein
LQGRVAGQSSAGPGRRRADPVSEGDTYGLPGGRSLQDRNLFLGRGRQQYLVDHRAIRELEVVVPLGVVRVLPDLGEDGSSERVVEANGPGLQVVLVLAFRQLTGRRCTFHGQPVARLASGGPVVHPRRVVPASFLFKRA